MAKHMVKFHPNNICQEYLEIYDETLANNRGCNYKQKVIQKTVCKIQQRSDTRYVQTDELYTCSKLDHENNTVHFFSRNPKREKSDSRQLKPFVNKLYKRYKVSRCYFSERS